LKLSKNDSKNNIFCFLCCSYSKSLFCYMALAWQIEASIFWHIQCYETILGLDAIGDSFVASYADSAEMRNIFNSSISFKFPTSSFNPVRSLFIEENSLFTCDSYGFVNIWNLTSSRLITNITYGGTCDTMFKPEKSDIIYLTRKTYN
jgi:hypothetical protein